MRVTRPDALLGLSQPWAVALVLLTCALAAFLALFWTTLSDIVDLWQTATYSHCFLVLPISIFFVLQRRLLVAQLPPTPNRLALLALVPLALSWVVASLTDVGVIAQFACVAMLEVLIWAIVGSQVFVALLFPLAYLFVAVPFGEELIPFLQDITARLARIALDASGVPVVLEGRILSISAGRWEVAQACAGLRFLLSSIAVGAVYAQLIYRRWTRRLVFLIGAVLLSVLGNAARVYGLVWLSHRLGNQAGVYADHLLYGWVFSSLLLLSLFSIGWFWREVPPRDAPEAQLPETRSSRGPRAEPFRVSHAIVVGVAAIALCGAAPITARLLASHSTGSSTEPSLLPLASRPWAEIHPVREDLGPQFVGAQKEFNGEYHSGPKDVHLYIAYYAWESRNRKLISSVNYFFDEKKWKSLARRDRGARIDGKAYVIHQTEVQFGHQRKLLWSWYWVRGAFTASRYQAKLFRAAALISGEPSASAAISVATDIGEDEESAEGTLQDFLDHLALRVTLAPLAQSR